MKILLICMAFAAMSLAMPIAEENTDVPAAPIKDEPQTTDLKKPADPVLVKKEVEKEPELVGKIAPADISSDKKPIEAQLDATPADKLEDKSVESKPEEPKTEEKSDKTIPKSEQKVENSESNSAESNSKSEEAKVDEIGKEATGKSAIVGETIDVDSAFIEKQAVAEEPADPSVLIPTPKKKIDLPTAPKTDADATSETKAEKLPAADAEPSKTEEPKTNAEKSPAESESLRIVRDTVDDKIVLEGKKEEAKPEEKIEAVAKKETNPIEKAKSVLKEEEKKSLEEPKSENAPLVPTKEVLAEVEVPAEAKKEPAVVEATKKLDTVELPRETPPVDPINKDSASPADGSSSSEENSDSSEKKEENLNKNSSDEINLN